MTNLRFAGEISRLLVYAPLRGLRRPAIGAGMYFSVSHRSSIQHGRTTALASSLVALPASLGLLRAVSRTARALRAPLAFACAVFRVFALCRRRRPSVPALRTACARAFSPSGLRLRTTLRFVCSALQPFGPSPFCKHLHPQFAIVDLHRSQARLWHSLLHWAYSALFRAQRARFVRPSPSAGRCSVPAHFVCSSLQPFGPSPFCKHLRRKIPEMTYTPSFLI